MSEETILAPISDLLPDRYAAPGILSAISSDGQVYAVLPDGRWARVEIGEVPLLLNRGEWRLATKKKKSGKRTSAEDRDDDWTQRIVRRLIHERWHCRDCAHEESLIHFLWCERRCPACWSLNVDVVETYIVQERPPQFGNIGEPRSRADWYNVGKLTRLSTHVWGQSPYEDGITLKELSDSYRFEEKEGHTRLYLLQLFAQTLLQLHYEVDQEYYFNLLLNVANVTQRYFQLTGSPDAARAMLDYFEQAALLEDDPVPISLAKHSFGMAVIYLLDMYNEPQAELITGRSNLRRYAISGLRDALHLVDDEASEHYPNGALQQRIRIQYALADLLARGRATQAEFLESIDLFRGLTKAKMGRGLELSVRTTRAEVQLLLDLPQTQTRKSLKSHLDAAKELSDYIYKKKDPLVLKRRWHWALTLGQFLWRHGARDVARPYLESAVTFIRKDTTFRTDSLTVTSDSERYHQAFSVLATIYTAIGWWFEALSLLETYRGRVIQMASLTETERQKQEDQAKKDRDDLYFGELAARSYISLSDATPLTIRADEVYWEEMTGGLFGPFTDDYELPGLSDRLLELFDQLRDEDTLLISLSIDDTTVKGQRLSAIILGPPAKPQRPGKFRVWGLSEEQMQMLTSDINFRQSGFREQRLQKLGELLFEYLFKPIEEDLKFFGCRRALLAVCRREADVPYL